MQSRELKGFPGSTAASLPVFPYTLKNIPIVAVDESNKIDALKKLREKLKEREVRLVNELNAIETFIDGISDSEMRQIIQYKYIDELTWAATAMKIYGSPCEDRARKHFKKYLE